MKYSFDLLCFRLSCGINSLLIKLIFAAQPCCLHFLGNFVAVFILEVFLIFEVAFLLCFFSIFMVVYVIFEVVLIFRLRGHVMSRIGCVSYLVSSSLIQV